MESKNDSELNELLREWKAPELPASLETRVFRSRRTGFTGLLKGLVRGYVRVPVPVACCLLVLIAAETWRIVSPSGTSGCSAVAIQAPVRTPPDARRSVPSTSCATDSAC